MLISGLELLVLREELFPPEATQSQMSFFVSHPLFIGAITLGRSWLHDGLNSHFAQHGPWLPDTCTAAEAALWLMEADAGPERRHNLRALFALCFCVFFPFWLRELLFFQASSAMCIKRSVSRFTHRFYSKTVSHHVETAACPFQDALVTFYGLTWSLSPVSYFWRLLWIGEISVHKDTAAGHLFFPKSS